MTGPGTQGARSSPIPEMKRPRPGARHHRWRYERSSGTRWTSSSTAPSVAPRGTRGSARVVLDVGRLEESRPVGEDADRGRLSRLPRSGHRDDRNLRARAPAAAPAPVAITRRVSHQWGQLSIVFSVSPAGHRSRDPWYRSQDRPKWLRASPRGGRRPTWRRSTDGPPGAGQRLRRGCARPVDAPVRAPRPRHSRLADARLGGPGGRGLAATVGAFPAAAGPCRGGRSGPGAAAGLTRGAGPTAS